MAKTKKENFRKQTLIHISSLKGFAITLCRNEFDADDLVSDTILRAFENYNRLRDKNKIKQWLFRILYNQFITEYRRRKTNTNLEIYNPDNFSLFEELSVSNFTDNNNPEKEFINNLTEENIWNAINSLPIEFRQTIILCDTEEFSYAEISVITGVPVGTVRSRISRGRSILQKKLWRVAMEIGIKKIKKPKSEKEYVCNCGSED